MTGSVNEQPEFRTLYRVPELDLKQFTKQEWFAALQQTCASENVSEDAYVLAELPKAVSVEGESPAGPGLRGQESTHTNLSASNPLSTSSPGRSKELQDSSKSGKALMWQAQHLVLGNSAVLRHPYSFKDSSKPTPLGVFPQRRGVIFS